MINSPKILVAEDEKPIRNIICGHLRKNDYEVFEAGDGITALDTAQHELPDLVVLDIMMPKLDGLEVCRRLREDIATRRIPILFLSARDAESDILRGLALGGDEYVTKPFSPVELVARIGAMLRRIAEERDLNPLTGFPGNAALSRHVQHLLDGDVNFALIYADLDHFKGYNDAYGFERGDDAIRAEAAAIVAGARAIGSPQPFVGHLGGDDFIIQCHVDKTHELCQAIIADWIPKVGELYEKEDRERGWILSQDRRGNPVRYPMLTLSLGVTLSAQHQGIGYAQLANFAAECKKKAKTLEGNSIYFDKRHSTVETRAVRSSSSRMLKKMKDEKRAVPMMMEPHCIATRRSIRRFMPDPVPEAIITEILEAARLAPSGTNAQPWTFLVVRKLDTRKELEKAAYGQKFVGEAPAIIVCLGNRKQFNKRLRRGKELVDIGAVDGSVMISVGEAYKKRFEEEGAVDRSIMINCAIATEHMALAAAARNLGTCWVMLFEPEKVSEILELPKHLFPVALLPIGYPAQNPSPRPRYELDEIAFREDFEHPWKG